MVGVSIFLGAGLGMILFNILEMPGAWFIILPLLGAALGFSFSRIVFQWYFEKQKRQYAQIISAIKKRLRGDSAQEAMRDETAELEEEDVGVVRSGRERA